MSDSHTEIANALGGAAKELADAKAEVERIAAESSEAAFNLLFVEGLYAGATTDTPLGEAIESKLRYGGFAFDAYCVSCKRETTFRVAAKEILWSRR